MNETLKKVGNNFMVSDAWIKFPNFSGKGSSMNREGDRQFVWKITDPDIADDLREFGFNVREKEWDGTVYWELKIKVSFAKTPPRIHLITGEHDNVMDEDMVGDLDKIYWSKFDFTFTPYNWKMANGSSGVSAYLKAARVIQRIDDPYDDMPY